MADVRFMDEFGGGPIDFRGRFGAKLMPVPTTEIRRAERRMLADLDGPGDLITFPLGWDPAQIVLEFQLLPQSMVAQLSALFHRWNAQLGKQKGFRLQSLAPEATVAWVCEWACGFKPEASGYKLSPWYDPTTPRPDLLRLKFDPIRVMGSVLL